MERFTPETAFATLARERITRVYGPTTMFIDMLEHPSRGRYDTRTLRQVNLFPGPFTVEFLRELMAGLQAEGVSGGYGLTETTNGALFVCSWRDGLEKVAETVGRPRDQYELRIADPETGQPLGAGQSGEICFRGFNVMRGYYGKPEETAKAIDADGWLRTGDLGMIDDEGYLRFLGRLKDMIKSAGFNVSCQEVEAVLMQHPAVLEATLVGVPDARLTEAGVAYVRLRAGAACSETELLERCRARLARYKVPKHVRFVAEFPLSASGKIQKFVLRDRFVAEDRWIAVITNDVRVGGERS
jgi:fatty-acyl-CoA synthase